MAIALGLLVLLAFTVIFHFVSPWWFTPLASNWGAMDDTIVLTFWICGLVFIAISIFMIYCVVKYRHREGNTAEFEPEHKTLEMWLIGLTSLGVVGLLAPGLKVWGDFIQVPDDAHVVEAVAQQWQWMYRYPGDDGELGTAHVKHVSFDNPVGINPDDPNGQDDIVVTGDSLRLPKDKPVKVLLRSKDVLHNFYVPQFRAKMDVVPGLVSYLWFTPTKLGTYEVACAELCGVGHYNMRSQVEIVDDSAYLAWLQQQPTFAASVSTAPELDPLVERGREVAQQNGCMVCHSVDGSSGLGPTWKGMYGKTETLDDGSTVVVDDAYFIESITNPAAKIVQGYAAVMPPATLSDEDMQALIAYARSGSESVDETQGATTTERRLSGESLSKSRGCIACHSVTGSAGVGPSWKGLAGSERELTDGSTVIADSDYLRRAINDPNAEIVKGYSPLMPPVILPEAELEAIVDYIESVK